MVTQKRLRQLFNILFGTGVKASVMTFFYCFCAAMMVCVISIFAIPTVTPTLLRFGSIGVVPLEVFFSIVLAILISISISILRPIYFGMKTRILSIWNNIPLGEEKKKRLVRIQGELSEVVEDDVVEAEESSYPVKRKRSD
jgi:hypothetical protein